MISTKTPFRMSFFGGGTDIPDFFNKYGGAVISTSIDKYCYVLIRHLSGFFDYSTELSYSIIERVTNVDDIVHPLIKNAMKELDISKIRLSYEADLPARSGLGTSSSFAVGMLKAFHEIKGEHPSKKELADQAIYIERVLCGEAGGWQDQIASSFGGFNRIDFSDNGYEVTPLDISSKRKVQLNDNLMMFFTGFTRLSSEIQRENNLADGSKNAQLLEILSLVDEAQSVLTNDDVDLIEVGRLFDETWKIKRLTGGIISTASIDQMYKSAKKAGATGGKLLGAGGGGFFVFYVEKDKQDCVKEALKDFMHVPFRFENDGSQVIYNWNGISPSQ